MIVQLHRLIDLRHYTQDLGAEIEGYLSPGCGGDLTAPSGSITSPNYPGPYPHHAECSWRVSVGRGSRVHLVITDLDMEAGVRISRNI